MDFSFKFPNLPFQISTTLFFFISSITVWNSSSKLLRYCAPKSKFKLSTLFVPVLPPLPLLFSKISILILFLLNSFAIAIPDIPAPIIAMFTIINYELIHI